MVVNGMYHDDKPEHVCMVEQNRDNFYTEEE